MTIFVIGLIVGCIVGRLYSWMKYHYPESREMINLKVAELRRERVAEELSTERMRRELDEILRDRQRD